MDGNDRSDVAINCEQNQPIQHQRDNSISSKDMKRTAKVHKRWNRRLKFFFCCLGYKKNKESFADVASIFADFFTDLDATAPEIVAGFVTLAKFQKAQREWNVINRKDSVYQYLSCLPISSDTKFLDVSEAGDSHLVNELIYYMNYSLAIFGWPMQMIDDPCMLCCIYPYLRISPCCGARKWSSKNMKAKEKKKKSTTSAKSDINKDQNEQKATTAAPDNDNSNNNNDTSSRATNTKGPSSRLSNPSIPGQLADDCDTPIIIDDNCCSCNAASVERRLAVHNYEIIYITYHVDISRVPFLVAADHSKQTIVVAMRGSMSLDDVVTDMNGQIDKLPIKNCPEDWLCHRGISRAANYIKMKLIEDGILDRAFNCRPDLGSQDYNLILCGHSLGAGAAAILGILMHDQYPDLKAYLYSPPGGILSLPVVEYTKQFAIGIILGNDCVPRLGVAQFERLRYHVFLSLRNAQQSPCKILTKTFCPCCCSKKTKIEYDPQDSIDLLHGENGQTFEYRGIKIPFQVQPQLLYVPGRILHIVKNYTLQNRATRLFKGPVYQAIWVENTSYDRVIVANRMFCDHLPNNLMHAMKMLFVNTLPVRKNSKSARQNSVLNDDTANSPCAIKQTKAGNQRQRININHTYHDHDDEKHNVIHKYQQDDNNNNCVDQDVKAFKDNYIDDENNNDSNNNTSSINNRNADHDGERKDDESGVRLFDDNGNDENTLNRNHVHLGHDQTNESNDRLAVEQSPDSRKKSEKDEAS